MAVGLWELPARLCENCVKEALSDAAEYYESWAKDITTVGVTSPGKYIYSPVARMVGGGKILDVGCGQGHILSMLKGKGYDLYEFDLARSLVKIARKTNEGVHFLIADAQNIPFSSNTFNYVICTEVIEHVKGDKVVKECYRVLKPGGIALLTVPNKNGAGDGHNPLHVQSFTFKSFTGFCKQAGFEVVSGEKLGFYIPIVSHLTEALSLVFRKNLPLAGPLNIKVPEFLAMNFLVKCRKPTT